MYWTNIQIFGIGTHIWWVWLIRPAFRNHARVVAVVTDVGVNRRTLAYLTFYCVCWHSTMDGSSAAWMHMLTLPTTRLCLKFGPVTPALCRCICAMWAARWAFPCFPVYSYSPHGNCSQR